MEQHKHHGGKKKHTAKGDPHSTKKNKSATTKGTKEEREEQATRQVSAISSAPSSTSVAGWDRDYFLASDFDPAHCLGHLVYKTTSSAKSSSGGGGRTAAAGKTPQQRASELVSTLENAKHSLTQLLHTEEQSLRSATRASLQAQAQEKRDLLESRDAVNASLLRVHDTEQRLGEASTATLGIERHMQLAYQRVTRGRNVLDMLRHFESFAQFAEEEMAGFLETLSDAREELRLRTTDSWVAPGGLTAATAADVDFYASAQQDQLHPLEAEVVAKGFSRVFALRESTEVAVGYLQRLGQLSSELATIVPNSSGNVAAYIEWAEQELTRDCFHLVECYTDLHAQDAALAASCSAGRAVLRSITQVSRLFAVLQGSADSLQQAFVDEAIKHVAIVVTEDLPLTMPAPLPPLDADWTPAMQDVFEPHNRQELAELRQALVVRVARDVLLLDAMFAADTQSRINYATRLFAEVMAPFVKRTIESTDENTRMALQAEARLSPRSKRRTAARCADAISYSVSMLAELFTFSAALAQELQPLFPTGDSTFSTLIERGVSDIFTNLRIEYVNVGVEAELHRRLLSMLDDEYTRDFVQVPDAVYDAKAVHTIKHKRMLSAAEGCLQRAQLLCTDYHLPHLCKDLCVETLKQLAAFVGGELDKTLELLRQQSGSQWTRRLHIPKKEAKTMSREAYQQAMVSLYVNGGSGVGGSIGGALDDDCTGGAGVAGCALRLLLWAQTALADLNIFLAKHLRGILITVATTSSSTVASPTTSQPNLSAPANATAQSTSKKQHQENAATAVAVATTTTQQHLLIHHLHAEKAKLLQNVEHKARSIVLLLCSHVVTRSLSILRAEQHRTDYKVPKPRSKPQEEELLARVCSQPSLACQCFCGFLARQLECLLPLLHTCKAASSRVATTTPSMLGGGKKGAPSATSATAQQQQQSRTTPSICQFIAFALHRGVFAHLLSFVVNDTGALVVKNDVAAFRRAVQPLIDEGADSAVAAAIARKFDTLKEMSNLLLVPLDNISSVRSSGLLQYLSQEEQMAIVKMREDVHAAFKQINK